ncbi:MAG: 23S rRNA (pseudouridine(1915)-N(3))-methyltransferase RlmH [Gammaproteobacteria bacterium]
MKIKILSIGNSMPTWVSSGVQVYTQRLPAQWRPQLIEIPRPKGALKSKDRHAHCRREGEALLAHLADHLRVIALDPQGKTLDTKMWTQKVQNWAIHDAHIALLIGGSDGLHETCLERADEVWSLSALTFPHMMVRLLVVEQLYRAWTILHGHPYDK